VARQPAGDLGAALSPTCSLPFLSIPSLFSAFSFPFLFTASLFFPLFSFSFSLLAFSFYPFALLSFSFHPSLFLSVHLLPFLSTPVFSFHSFHSFPSLVFLAHPFSFHFLNVAFRLLPVLSVACSFL
jgi:hypothetical protein